MARPIVLTTEQKNELLAEFTKQLNGVRMADAGIKVEKKYKLPNAKTSVTYTADAWFKTIMLIEENGKEVGWHAVCFRDPSDDKAFIVTDILVYPQKVTGATINPDPAEYAAWMNGLDDDTFNNMRGHIHSHVNMPVSPSGTDERFREDRIAQLREDDFYIFQIMNKRGNISSAVYDLKYNTYYENADVETLIECESMEQWDTYKTIAKMLLTCDQKSISGAVKLFTETNMATFLGEAKKVVVEEKVTYNGKYNYNTYGGYGTYGTGGYKRYGSGSAQVGSTWTPTTAQNNTASGAAKEAVEDAEVDVSTEEEMTRGDVEAVLRQMYGDDYVDMYGDDLLKDPFYSTQAELASQDNIKSFDIYGYECD